MHQRVKIVATIGPNTANSTTLKQMFQAGMSVARLNGSHNTLAWHKNTIKLIKKVLPNCPILLDIPGKKIRTAKLKYEPSFKVGDILTLTTKSNFDGIKKIPLTNKRLHQYLSKGDIIFADDGTLKFSVLKVTGNDIYIKAHTNGILKSSKGINVPHVNLGKSAITSRDKKMIQFAILNKIDFIGLSFIENGDHLIKIRKIIKGNIPKLVAKIENKKGIENLSDIIKKTDCIMIDRGDLSTETNIETLAINQKKIIATSLKYAKPVIVATEMLDNMINNPFPTKAEALDIFNSIADGATATMLSGETAVGKYPVESIKVMAKIANTSIVHNEVVNSESENEIYGMATAIKNLCNMLPINKIITVTASGFAPRIISAQKIKQPIIAVTNNEEVSKGFNLFFNTKGVFFQTKFYKDNLQHISKCVKFLWNKKEISSNDFILIVALAYPSKGRRMNIIQTHYVKDLIRTFSWK